MTDPLEGTTNTGTIVTGAARHRIPARFEPVLGDLVATIAPHAEVSVYVFGSVANGTAQPPRSDVDVLAIDIDQGHAERLTSRMSERYAHLCRGVDVGGVASAAIDANNDEAYGFQVFLRHYCVHLTGPDRRPTIDFPADERAARGFNGDIAQHLDRWKRSVGEGIRWNDLGRRVARKTLLAAAGLASVETGQWTTSREAGAAWWAGHFESDATGAAQLLTWANGTAAATAHDLRDSLDGVVGRVAAEFARSIGLWADR